MKRPVRFAVIAVIAVSAMAAVVWIAVRYMDVLQRQFEWLKEMVAKRLGQIPVCCDEEMGDLGDIPEEEIPHMQEPYDSLD